MTDHAIHWDWTAILESEVIPPEQAIALLKEWELQPLPEYSCPDAWHRGTVVVRQLANMFGLIGRNHQAPIRASKGFRMGDIADSICANFCGWSDSLFRDPVMKAKLFSIREKRILVHVGSDGRAYVGDGNKRVLNACIHREPTITALISEVDDVWPEQPEPGTHPTWQTG